MDIATGELDDAPADTGKDPVCLANAYSPTGYDTPSFAVVRVVACRVVVDATSTSSVFTFPLFTLLAIVLETVIAGLEIVT